MVKAPIVETASAIVARGRTVITPVEGETKIVGYLPAENGALAAVRMAVTRVLAPGDAYSGPRGEIERLRLLGYLED
jgi:hypothetical protein